MRFFVSCCSVVLLTGSVAVASLTIDFPYIDELRIMTIPQSVAEEAVPRAATKTWNESDSTGYLGRGVATAGAIASAVGAIHNYRLVKAFPLSLEQKAFIAQVARFQQQAWKPIEIRQPASPAERRQHRETPGYNLQDARLRSLVSSSETIGAIEISFVNRLAATSEEAVGSLSYDMRLQDLSDPAARVQLPKEPWPIERRITSVRVVSRTDWLKIHESRLQMWQMVSTVPDAAIDPARKVSYLRRLRAGGVLVVLFGGFAYFHEEIVSHVRQSARAQWVPDEIPVKLGE